MRYHDKSFVQRIEVEGKSPEYFDYDFVAASMREMLHRMESDRNESS
jgi:hypothetical protein